MTVTECNDYGPHDHRKKPGRVPLTMAGNALLRNPPGPFTGPITRADIAEIERQAVERYLASRPSGDEALRAAFRVVIQKWSGSLSERMLDDLVRAADATRPSGFYCPHHDDPFACAAGHEESHENCARPSGGEALRAALAAFLAADWSFSEESEGQAEFAALQALATPSSAPDVERADVPRIGGAFEPGDPRPPGERT